MHAGPGGPRCRRPSEHPNHVEGRHQSTSWRPSATSPALAVFHHFILKFYYGLLQSSSVNSASQLCRPAEASIIVVPYAFIPIIKYVKMRYIISQL